MTDKDLYESFESGRIFHEQLLNTISIAQELLKLNYLEVMNLPLKDFYSLLKIRSEEEKKKAEYLNQQQQASMKSLKSNNKKFSYK